MSNLSVRPLGAIAIVDQEETGTYSVTITSTAISISNGTTAYSSDYVGKSLRQVVTELNTSSFPIEIRAIADINSLVASELIATGSTIPSGFDLKDRTTDGKGAIVRIKRWAVKYNERKTITLLPPVKNGTTLPWYAKVTDGEFTQKLNGITYTFSTPEYSRQAWSEKYGRPFKDAYGEAVEFRSASSISLKNSPIYYSNNNIVLGSDEKTYPSSIIKEVDQFNGIIFLVPGTIIPSNTLAYYSYISEYFNYKDLNLNGHFLQNPYILDKYIVYYLKPTSSSTGINRDRGVYHVVADSVEAAINYIPEDSPGEPVAIIGAISIRSYQNKNDLSILDTRSYGGGLRNDRIGEAAEKKHARSQYFYDIGRKEGIPYPGAAAIVIDLPSELKEVLTVDEIKTRASKFIAAGIYPVYNFKEEDYNTQFETVDGNANLSLFNTPVSEAYTGASTGIYGNTIEPAYWAGSEASFPVPVEGTGYSALDFNITAEVNTGESENYLKIPAGTIYTQKYLKSSADAIISWEERKSQGQWARKTLRDSRPVSMGRLIGGKASIDASLGYKEIRRFKAISPFIYNESDFYDSVLKETSSILNKIPNVGRAGNTGEAFIVSGQINNVINGDTSFTGLVNPGFITYNVGQYIHSYDNLVNANALYDIDVFYGIAKYIYDATTTSNTNEGDFPAIYDVEQDAFTGYSNQIYNIADDMFCISKLTNSRINYCASIEKEGNTALVNVLGIGLVSGAGDPVATLGQSGTFQLYKKFIEVSSITGVYNVLESDILSPFVNPFSDSSVDLILSSNTGEFDSALNQDSYSSFYIKAAAAVYSTFVLPLSGRSLPGLHYPALSTNISFDPLMLALSGIGHRYESFENHITPTSGSDELSNTWLTSYNRLSSYASKTLSHTSSALDSIVYGNSEWAGAINTGEKTGPYYHPISLANIEYRYDTFIHTGNITSVKYSLTGTPYNYIKYLIRKNYDLVISLEDSIRTSAKKGGLYENGIPVLIANHLWLPIHNLKNDELFTDSTNSYLSGVLDVQRLVDTFEIASRSFIKAAIDENGITSEAGVFQWDRAPLYGGVPSDAIIMCAKAIELYTLSGDDVKRSEWVSIAEGLFNNTTGEYSKLYGYPYSTVNSSVMSGNIGGNQLGAYASLLGNKQTPYTAEEVLAITGA